MDSESRIIAYFLLWKPSCSLAKPNHPNGESKSYPKDAGTLPGTKSTRLMVSARKQVGIFQPAMLIQQVCKSPKNCHAVKRLDHDLPTKRFPGKPRILVLRFAVTQKYSPKWCWKMVMNPMVQSIKNSPTWTLKRTLVHLCPCKRTSSTSHSHLELPTASMPSFIQKQPQTSAEKKQNQQL